ncbi:MULTISPECIES: H-NS family nucleoid-associated regulatory protein [unclassified Janthinobacterium]|uniref:H-NS histone family protein n=1 Tax=unclassified Janthinobacterium TaxID=2610881 RepID=UPI0008815E33|nr:MULTISPECIES: H-NS histone family protein [unclassified Janthinobacterium]SDA47852.1 DNA-binding protein H-NS [Janthinobacterium sp. 551a]SFB39329.1 DNA-binding protein H-NS [Janthinobacterium sp. 344]
MNVSTMTMVELRNLQEKVQQEISQRERQDLSKAREQIMAIAQQAGIPLKQLILDGLHPRTGKVAVRFRNPENAAEQWTGRGRQPLWVKNWVESGKSIDLLRV